MELREHAHGSVCFFAAEEMQGAAVSGFSTRAGGVSKGVFAGLNLGLNRGDAPEDVRENYRRFFAALGANPQRLAMAGQVHGNVVRRITRADVKRDLYAPLGYEADGLMTNEAGIALVVFGADCPSILLCDPVSRAVAAVHSGWRGTAQSIAAIAVQQMGEAYGARPEHILAAVGPCISRCCFETDADVPEAMQRALGAELAAFPAQEENGKFHVDLKEINAKILQHAGVLPEHIAVSGDCTACQPEKYWSHRKLAGQRGSQAAVMMLREKGGAE